MPRKPHTTTSPSLLYSGMKDSSEESDDSSSAGWSDKVDSSSSSSSSSSDSSNSSSHSEEEDPLPPAKSPPTKNGNTLNNNNSDKKTTSPKGSPKNGNASNGGVKKNTVSNSTPKAGKEKTATKGKTAPTTPKATASSPKSSPEVREATPLPTEKPNSPPQDSAARSLTPPRSPTRTLSPPLPPPASSNSLVSGRINDVRGESPSSGTDSAPTLPAKRVSKTNMYMAKGDGDDDEDESSSGSGSSDSFKSSKTRPESGEKLEAVDANDAAPTDPPKKRGFFGRLGGSKRGSGGNGSETASHQDDRSPTEDGDGVPPSEDVPKGQPAEVKSQRKVFGLFGGGRTPTEPVDTEPVVGADGSPGKEVPVEDVIAAQDEEVNFEAAPEAASNASKKMGWLSWNRSGGEPGGGGQGDVPEDSEAAATPRRRSWFSKGRGANDSQEASNDVEAGKVFSPSHTEATAREFGDKSDTPPKKRRNFLFFALAAVVLVGAVFGAAYGGVTLANQSNSSPQPAPVPAPASHCENDDVLLNLTIRFDAKPDKIGIELKDFGTANSAIWSFPSGSFRSFTQLRRTNFFQICLNPLPQYELSITSSDNTGLASKFAGTFIFGSWQLAYNGTVVSSYNGDCNVSDVANCGAFSSCDFVLAANSTNGTCTGGTALDPTTNSTAGTSAPLSTPTNATATAAPVVTPATAAPVATPATAAPVAVAATAAPQASTTATAAPGATSSPATTAPGGTPSPANTPATSPPGSTASPVATTFRL